MLFKQMHLDISGRAAAAAPLIATVLRTHPRKIALIALAACIALASGVPAATSPPGSLLAAGAANRTQLSSWTLRKDPANRGLGLGWQKGGFSGARISVPNVVSPLPYSGRAAQASYQGSVAWYRTTFNAPSAGVYALTFSSANFQANVWVDGHALGSHRGFYLPFELRPQLAAGGHTLVVRVDWRDPEAQAKEGFHRTWFNWGGLDGEVNVRELGASDLSDPTIATTLPQGPTGRRPSGDCEGRGQRPGAQRRRRRARDPPGRGAHARQPDDPSALSRTGPRPRPGRASEHDRKRARTGPVGAEQPELVRTDALVGR